MRDLFQSDLLTILHMKKIHIRNFDDYDFFGGIHQCFQDTQSSCYASASGSIYVPWSTMNATAIVSLINEFSEYVAIYPHSDMKHKILLDVTTKAGELNKKYSFNLPFPPKLKDIQTKISHYDLLIQCPPEVTDLLQMLHSNMVWIVSNMSA